MPVLTLTAKDFLLGESLADYVGDKGFSPYSRGLNLTQTKGVVQFRDLDTDRGGATLTGMPIAYAYDKTYLGNDTYILDDEGAFYTLNGAVFTKRQSITTDTFQEGTTDFIQFLGVTYATGQNRVHAISNSDLTALVDSFWSGLTATNRHPMEIVEDTLYLADGNLLHTITGVAVTTASVITLPTDFYCTTLRKHPDGRQLIAFGGTTVDYSHVRGAPGRAYLIDTNTKRWTREIQLESQIEGSRNVSGIIYVGYGSNIGYFNGDGVSFLKKLDTSTTAYNHHMGSMEGIFLVRDGRYVRAYGDLGFGKVWWSPYYNLSTTESVTIVAYKGDNKVLFGYGTAGTGTLGENDYDNTALYGQFVTNRVRFGAMSRVRRIEIDHQQTSGTFVYNIYTRDLNETELLLEQVTHTGRTIQYTRIECAVETDIFQLIFIPSNGALAIKEVRIFYESI